MSPKLPKRTYRLNTRLTETEYDAVYEYAKEHRCTSLDAAIRHMIATITGIGAKLVPTSCVKDRVN